MNIPIHLITPLIEIADAKTFSEVAQRLKTTQPTVSRQFKQLQDLLPYPLFEQRGRNKVLTTYGKLLVQKLSERFSNLDSIFQEALIEQGQKENVNISIGGRSEIIKKYFGTRTIQGQLSLIPMGSYQLRSALSRGELDVGISQEDVVCDGYIRKKFFSDHLCLVVPKSFFKLTKQNINKWEAESYKFPYCTFKQPILEVKRTLNKLGFKVAPVDQFVLPDWEVLEERVHRALNWSIIPHSYIKPDRNYEYVQMDQNPDFIFYIYYRKSLSRLDWFRNFLEI